MQVFCKLYQWDPPTSGWKEKGKGNLRLNDRFTDGKTCSRLIMRTSGSYKLILNCLLVHGMKFELANDCLRFSTVDGIQLIKGKTSELEQVRLAVDKRLRDLPKRAKSVPDSDSTSICNGTGASSTDNETHNIAQSCVTSTATITTSSSSSATSSTSTSAVSTSDTQ